MLRFLERDTLYSERTNLMVRSGQPIECGQSIRLQSPEHHPAPGRLERQATLFGVLERSKVWAGRMDDGPFEPGWIQSLLRGRNGSSLQTHGDHGPVQGRIGRRKNGSRARGRRKAGVMLDQVLE